MPGGSLQLENPDPEIERIYPITARIAHHLRRGRKVYRRQVIVVDEWAEVIPD